MAFAPQPIRIRYGDDGALGAAAVQAGKSAGFEQQKALDMQFISDEMTRRQQAAQFAQQNAMEAHKLQMAGALSYKPQQQASGPAPRQGPLANEILAKKQASLSAAGVNKSLSDEQRPIFEAAASDPNVDPSQFERMLDDAGQATAKAQNAQASSGGKRAFYESVKNRLTPDEQSRFSSMLDQPGVSVDQLRLSVNEAIDQRTVLPRTQLAYQVQGIDAQIRAKRQQMESIERRLAKEGVSSATDPSALNPQYANPDESTYGKMGFVGSLSDAYNPNSTQSLVSGGKPKAQQAMVEYARMQNELKALEQQRQQAMTQSQAIAGGAPPAAAAQGVEALSDDDLLRALTK